MPQGFTGDVRQTVLESTSQRETRAPDSLLVVVSNGIEGEGFRATVHPSVQAGAQTQEGGEAAPLHPFSWAQGLHHTAWSYWQSYWPVPFRHVLSHMGRCSLQHERVTESRAGDSSVALPGRWPLRAVACGFPRNGQDSIWWGQVASAASNPPVWCSVTGRREVVANARTISGPCCCFHCLSSSLGCDHQRNFHPHLVKRSLANKRSLYPPTLFAVKR